MKIVKQFTHSTLAAMLTHVFFFIITGILDKFINSEISNFIGLIIDLILDYVVQQRVFMNKFSMDIKIITKYIGSEILFISLNQFIFSYYYRNYYNYNHNLTIVRILISIFIYVFFGYF